MNSEKAYYERLEIQNKILEDKYTQALKVAQERFDRIQKAIEYIEHYGNLYCLRHKQFKEYKQYEDLLDILKGGNNE